jgi:hypothetical protein
MSFAVASSVDALGKRNVVLGLVFDICESWHHTLGNGAWASMILVNRDARDGNLKFFGPVSRIIP